MYSALYTVQCTVHRTLYTVQCTLLCTVQCTVHYTVNSAAYPAPERYSVGSMTTNCPSAASDGRSGTLGGGGVEWGHTGKLRGAPWLPSL